MLLFPYTLCFEAVGSHTEHIKISYAEYIKISFVQYAESKNTLRRPGGSKCSRGEGGEGFPSVPYRYLSSLKDMSCTENFSTDFSIQYRYRYRYRASPAGKMIPVNRTSNSNAERRRYDLGGCQNAGMISFNLIRVKYRYDNGDDDRSTGKRSGMVSFNLTRVEYDNGDDDSRRSDDIVQFDTHVSFIPDKMRGWMSHANKPNFCPLPSEQEKSSPSPHTREGGLSPSLLYTSPPRCSCPVAHSTPIYVLFPTLNTYAQADSTKPLSRIEAPNTSIK